MKRLCLSRTTLQQETHDDFENCASATMLLFRVMIRLAVRGAMSFWAGVAGLSEWIWLTVRAHARLLANAPALLFLASHTLRKDKPRIHLEGYRSQTTFYSLVMSR